MRFSAHDRVWSYEDRWLSRNAIRYNWNF